MKAKWTQKESELEQDVRKQAALLKQACAQGGVRMGRYRMMQRGWWRRHRLMHILKWRQLMLLFCMLKLPLWSRLSQWAV
jgi:hypothetical protein